VNEDIAAASTRLLRTDDGPVWSRLRELLVGRGFDPNSIALANFFQDDTDMELGIIVTPDDHVYEFGFQYGKGDLKQQARTAWITEWRDRTERWRDTAHRTEIESARRLLGSEQH
jgi:hypothetical protein